MSPRKAVVEHIDEVLPADYESSILKVRRNLESILGPDVHIHFGRSPQSDAARLSILMTGTPRYRPLRWSELESSQRKALENFIPYVGTDDFVRYGDTVIVTCPKAEWEKELVRKARVAKDADHPSRAAAQFGRETGLPVDTAWDERGMASPRVRQEE